MEIVDSIRRITSPDAPLMEPASQYSRQDEGRASMFLVEIEHGQIAYRYDVNIVLRSYNPQLGKEFTKDFAKGPDEGLRSRNRNLCYDILATAYARCHPEFGFFDQDGGEIVYDCKSTMYTNLPILVDQEIQLRTADCNDFIRTYCSDGTIFVKIVPNQTGHTLQLDDFMQYTEKSTIHKEDRSIRTFIEMAVAQNGINNYLYTPIGAGKLFECETQQSQDHPVPELRPVGMGMVLRSGIAKGVRVVKNDGNPMPALVVDVKVSPFFMNQCLVDTVMQMGPGGQAFPRNGREWNDVARLLQDVRVEFKPHRNRTFGIRDISSMPASQTMVKYNEQHISVEQYYLQTLGHVLEHPDLRCVIPDFADRLEAESPDRYFPMEMLIVMPDQRVPLQKMSARLSQDLLGANSLPPAQRYARVIEHCARLNLFSGENAVLRAFGIKIHRNSNECKINVRSAPRILFRGDQPVIPDQKADWKRSSVGKQYFMVEPIGNWVVLHPSEREADVKEFVHRFMQAAAQRGMRFNEGPQFWAFNGRDWNDIFDECKRQDVQFVVLIDRKVDDTHGQLKYYEVRTQILTQHISLERVTDVIRTPKGPQTLQNILNKTNLKYSGLNYQPLFERAADRFRLENNQVLVVGYDVAHPPPMSASERRQVQAVRQDLLSFDPSVIGITANMSVHPHNFVGDYYYQSAMREGIDYDQLADRFKWVLETLGQARPAADKPKYIFVIRNGLSEGQFAESVSEELKALREGCRRYDAGYAPKFVYILGTKRHYKKFYACERGGQRVENMTPGSVVDSKFVREDCPEFFMQSHYALKGVGKPVAYNVLYDDIGVTKDEIEGLLNSLCFSHQIVNSAVSMPEPIYQADELAKRGRNNYITMKRLDEAAIPRHGPHNFVDFDALNEMLTYRNYPVFITTRFTA